MSTIVAVYLIMVIRHAGNGVVVQSHPMPSWEECYRAVKESKVLVSNGDENEAVAVLYCAGSKP